MPAGIRPPACVGVYPPDPDDVRATLAGLFPADAAGPPPGTLRAVLAPHMDYRRGNVTYGHAFHALRHTPARLFVIVATSHHSRERFTLTRDHFLTPLGVAETDQRYVEFLASRYGMRAFADRHAHGPEHSIELEVLLLQYLFPDEPFRIVPLLVGSFHDAVMTGVPPAELPDVARMVAALRDAEAAAGEPVCYLISGDLAHIGPKFRDPWQVDADILAESRRRDAAILQPLAAADADGYFDAIAAEVDSRRICGLSPTVVALHAARPTAGHLLHYQQYVCPTGFESVSFAAAAFTGSPLPPSPTRGEGEKTLMGLPFATAADLHTARERYAREAVPGVVQTPRYRLRYVTLGPPDGKPLLFVHGMADRALSFCLLMTRLADAGFRCVAFELANGKDDGANLGNYKHPHFTADVVCLLDHLGVARTDIFGSSFGSTITLRSLIEQPGRFRRAVVQGGFARRPLIPIERGLARLARYWPVRMAALPFREQAMAKLELPQFAHADPALYRFLVENSGWTPCRAAARRSLLIDRLDLRPALPHIRQPLLMIGGDADLIVPRLYEAEVEAGVPDVRRIEYAGCGHYPQYVLPAPTAAAVADFLS